MGNTKQDSTNSLQDRCSISIPVRMVYERVGSFDTSLYTIPSNNDIWLEWNSNRDQQVNSRDLTYAQ